MKLLRRTFLSALASSIAAIWAKKAKAGFAIFQVGSPLSVVSATWYVNRDAGAAASHSSATPGGLTETLALAASNDSIALFPNINYPSYGIRAGVPSSYYQQITGTAHINSNVIDGISDTSELLIGMNISSAALFGGIFSEPLVITSVLANSITVNQNAVGGGSAPTLCNPYFPPITTDGLTFKSAYVRNPVTNHPQGVSGRSTMCPPDGIAACKALGMAQIDQWEIPVNNTVLDNLIIQVSQWGRNIYPKNVAIPAGKTGTVIKNCYLRHGRAPGYAQGSGLGGWGGSPVMKCGNYGAHDSYGLNQSYPEYNNYGPGAEASALHALLATAIDSQNTQAITVTDNTIADIYVPMDCSTQTSGAAGVIIFDRNLMIRCFFHPTALALNQPPVSYSQSWNIYQQPLSSTNNTFVLTTGTVASTSGSPRVITGIPSTAAIDLGMFVVDWTNDNGQATAAAGPFVQAGTSSLLQNFVSPGVNEIFKFPSVDSKTSTTVTLSAAASGGGAGTSIALRFVGDRNGAHSSMCLVTTASTTPDVPNLRWEGNIHFVGAAWSGNTYLGGLVTEYNPGPNGSWFEGSVFRGNLMIGNGNTMMTAEPFRNALVYGNTCAFQTPVPPMNYQTTAKLNVGSQDTTVPAGFDYISNNIAEDIQKDGDFQIFGGIVRDGGVGDKKIGLNGALVTQYFWNGTTGIFTGPSGFNPQNVTDLLSMYTPAAASGFGALGCLGNGYVDFAAMTINSNQEKTISDFVPITGLSSFWRNTAFQSNVSIIRGGPGNITVSLTTSGHSDQYIIYNDFAGTSPYLGMSFTSSPTSNVPEGKYIQIQFVTINAAGTTTATVQYVAANGTFSYSYSVTTA